jgi:hypothetical protein
MCICMLFYVWGAGGPNHCPFYVGLSPCIWLRCLLVWVKLNGVNLSLISLFHLNEDGIDVFD